MQWFSKLYQRVMTWARHKNAPLYLGILSFAESSFFPIPPDVMLAPMSLAHPDKAWRYATICTLASVAGGIFAYGLGMWAFAPLVEPVINFFGWAQAYTDAHAWLAEETFLVIFLAGFSPIPYKLFTLASGVLELDFLPFVIASIIGRGSRFYLVAGLMRWGGPRLEKHLQVYMEWIGWGSVVLIVGGYLLYVWLS